MKKEIVPFEVTFMSCVGIGSKDYPVSFGNYCGLGKYYCVNMWAENIKMLNRIMPKFKEVEITVFDNLCFVTDENIPKEWRSSFCLTGSGGTLSKYLKEALAFLVNLLQIIFVVVKKKIKAQIFLNLILMFFLKQLKITVIFVIVLGILKRKNKCLAYFKEKNC